MNIKTGKACMRKFTIITLFTAIVASGIYTGFWYFSAYRLKKEITAFFATDHPEFFLKHEGIASKGFPFTVEAAIKNPLIGPRTSTNFSNNVSTEGTWTLGGTILRTKGWVEISGKTMIDFRKVHLGTLAGTMRIEIPQPTKSLEISKQLQAVLPSKWSYLSLEILLRNASLHAKNLSLICGSGDQPLFEVDNLMFNWEAMPGARSDSGALLLKLDIQGYEMHQKPLTKLLYSSQLDPKQIDLLMENAKDYGKSNLSLQTRILYPSLDETKHFPLCVDVEKLTYSSVHGDSGSIEGKLKIDNLQSDEFSGRFSMNSVQKTSSQSHDFAVSQYRSLAHQFHQMGYLAQFPKLENLVVNHWDQIATLIPDYSSLGSIEEQIDLGFHVRQQGKQDEDWNVDLKKYAAKTPVYEIALKAYVGFRDSNETSFFEVQIPNYQEFIQNLAGYYNRWQAVLTSTQTFSEMEMPPVNHKVVNRMSEFLSSLSQPGPSKDLHIVVQRGSSDTNIGPFNFELFSSELEKFVVDVTAEMYQIDTHQSF
jgi:hypothetical protein